MSTRPLEPARSRGLSLIELLVVMTILGMVLFAALPNLSGWFRNTQIRTTAESMMSGLSKARNEAVRRNTPVRFSLVTTSSSDISQFDNSCALSATSSAWVVSVNTPVGGCSGGLSEDTAPMMLDRQARSIERQAVTVSATSLTNAGACSSTAANQLVFDGFGRITNAGSIGCIDINHSQGSGNRALRIVINVSGNLRMCEPAVTDTDDPRIC